MFHTSAIGMGIEGCWSQFCNGAREHTRIAGKHTHSKCIYTSCCCLTADPIEIHKKKLFLWFSHLPQEEKQFGGYFSPETMHVDPLILERKPEDRAGLLNSSLQSEATSNPSITVEQLFDPTDTCYENRGLNVLLYGAVGTGKSTVVRKLVLDWCSGSTLTHFKLMVPFSCEDLSQLSK